MWLFIMWILGTFTLGVYIADNMDRSTTNLIFGFTSFITVLTFPFLAAIEEGKIIQKIGEGKREIYVESIYIKGRDTTKTYSYRKPRY